MTQFDFKHRGNQIFTGISAEHYVAAEISRAGGIATLTAKNTPSYDLIASNKDGSKTVIIQVKAGRGDTGAFIVGSGMMPRYTDNAFHIFVLLKNDARPEYWIMPSNVVAEIAETGHRSSNSKSPRHLSWKLLRSQEFMERYHGNWNRLGIFDT